MKDGYPEEEELKTIETWDIADPFGLIDFIESITWTPDWCISVKGKRVKHFEFHTAGWSGNEEIFETRLEYFKEHEDDFPYSQLMFLKSMQHYKMNIGLTKSQMEAFISTVDAFMFNRHKKYRYK
jgi:hypothetical protein